MHFGIKGTFETAPTIVEPSPVAYQSGTNAMLSPKPQSNEWRGQSAGRRVRSPIPQQKPLPTRKHTWQGSPSDSRVSTPISSPRHDKIDWDDGCGWDDTEKLTSGRASPSVPTLVGLSKEEKAAEMARRKEERKQVWICECIEWASLTSHQRIAQLKEQKRNAPRT